jgi:hypothetical protein
MEGMGGKCVVDAANVPGRETFIWEETSKMNAKRETFEDRIRDAYLQMADKVHFRPQAPSDGFGNVQLTDEEIADPERLAKEANAYVQRFVEQEKSLHFRIGTGDWTNARALVYAIEAAKALCGGASSIDLAIKLLNMATAEAQDAEKHWIRALGGSGGRKN